MKGRSKDRMPSPEIDIYDIIPRIHLDPARMTKAPPPEKKESCSVSEHFVNMDEALEIGNIINQHK